MPPFTSKSAASPQSRNTHNKVWGATFPDDIDDCSQSTFFFTRCIYITFTHILASRQLLPQNVFKKRTIEGNLRVYVLDTNEVLGGRFIQKIKGVKHAIQQRYLRELMLVISPTEDNVNDAIEIYTWRMRYDVDGEPQAELRKADGSIMAALRFKGMEYLKKQTEELLLLVRRLCRETLAPLPEGACSVVRITYTDRTPKGYQAPGFYRAPEDPVLRPDAQEIEIGSIQTGYHGVSVTVRSIFIDDAYAVGLKLKEGLTYGSLNDSLNDSFGEEQGAGDDRCSDNNDTMELISGTPLQQSEAVEIGGKQAGFVDEARSRSSLGIASSESGRITRSSLAAHFGSVVRQECSDSTSPAEDFAVNSRHGRSVTSKARRGRAIHESSRTPGAATPQVVNVSTPSSTNPVDDSYDTPPAKKTPGSFKSARITPKEPPTKRKR